MSSPSPPLKESQERRRLRRLRLAREMADLAYFQARLSLIGDVTTIGAHAQRKTFKSLQKAQSHRITRQRREPEPG